MCFLESNRSKLRGAKDQCGVDRATCKSYLQVRREGSRDVGRTLGHHDLEAVGGGRARFSLFAQGEAEYYEVSIRRLHETSLRRSELPV